MSNTVKIATANRQIKFEFKPEKYTPLSAHMTREISNQQLATAIHYELNGDLTPTVVSCETYCDIFHNAISFKAKIYPSLPYNYHTYAQLHKMYALCSADRENSQIIVSIKRL